VTSAADPFGFAGFGFAVVAAVVVVVAGRLSAADFSAVAVDPGFPDFAVSAADPASFVYPFAEGKEKERERAVVLASCFLTRRFSF
jgi:hypothetical protein